MFNPAPRNTQRQASTKSRAMPAASASPGRKSSASAREKCQSREQHHPEHERGKQGRAQKESIRLKFRAPLFTLISGARESPTP